MTRPNKQLDPAANMLGVAITALGILVAAIIVVVALGCTTTKIEREMVPDPQPYWDPPSNIAPLPPEPELRAGTMPEPDTPETVTLFIRRVGQDLNACLASDGEVRRLYLLLVDLVTVEPSHGPTPDPGGDGSPSPDG